MSETPFGLFLADLLRRLERFPMLDVKQIDPSDAPVVRLVVVSDPVEFIHFVFYHAGEDHETRIHNSAEVTELLLDVAQWIYLSEC